MRRASTTCHLSRREQVGLLDPSASRWHVPKSRAPQHSIPSRELPTAPGIVSTLHGRSEFQFHASGIPEEQKTLPETYILDSIRLREVPYLVSAFSADGLRELINSKAFQIRCEPLVVSDIGQNAVIPEFGPLLSSGAYRFRFIRIAQFNDFVHRCMLPFH